MGKSTFDLQNLEPTTLLTQIGLYNNAGLRSILKILYEDPVKNYYCILACLYMLKLQGGITTTNTSISLLGKALQLQCKYVNITKQFNNNCVLVLARLNKLVVTYEQCKDIPFENFMLVVNFLHCLTDEQILKLLNLHIDHTELYEFIKLYLRGKNVRVKDKRVSNPYESLTFQITKGQYKFLQEKHKRWLEDNGKIDAPLETFLLECVRNYKKKSFIMPSLKVLLANIPPDKILSAFGEVYPDITIIAQYPYVK